MAVKKLLNDIYKYLIGYQEYVQSNIIGEFIYPVDLDFTLNDESKYYFPKDNDGVPQKKYETVGKQYNPTRVAAYGLANWNRYQQTKNLEYKNNFLISLNWFYNNQENGKWHYNFNWGNLESPWISCMSQGEGISILVRGFVLTNDPRYLKCAADALVPFTKMISEGGVRSKIRDNDIFFEEYPELNSVHVLNGYAYSLIGLLELYEIASLTIDIKKDIKKLLDEAIISLENNINRWDCGYWSAYDLHKERKLIRNVSTISYHMLHISQLNYIAKKTNSFVLLKVVDRWTRYIDSPINRQRALITKILYRLSNPAQR